MTSIKSKLKIRFNCTERYGIADYQVDTFSLSSKNGLIGTVKDVLHHPRESVVVQIGTDRKASFGSQ